jgi:cation transport ATPase
MSTERLTVPIRGLTRACCVARVEQAMRQQEGVIWATINFAAPRSDRRVRLGHIRRSQTYPSGQPAGVRIVLGTPQLLGPKARLPVRRHLLQTGLRGRAWRL